MISQFLGLAFTFAFVILSGVTAIAQHQLQIYAPGVQYRYEEGSDQQIDLRSYTHYAVNYMYDKVLLGIEHNTIQDNTGSTSLGVKANVKEWNVLAGYSLTKMELKDVTPNTNIEIMLFALAGKTKSEIETALNGVVQSDTSEEQSVLGVGGLIFFRLDYFILGADMRMMQSSAYLPKSVSVTTIKIGVNFNF